MNLWNEGLKTLAGTHCKAEYQEQIVLQNRGNPFIEAMPNRLNMNEFYDRLHSTPQFEIEQLKLGVEDRLELIQQIKPSFWLPFPSHYDKYRMVYNMIKIGYQSRNPLLPVYNRQFAMGWDAILEKGLDDNGLNIAGNIQTAQSATEIGLSGMGKSKIYERILKLLFPQVIHHHDYKGRKLLITQVVWLKIECPSGKSVGALCKNFYSAVDELLGSNFYEKHGEKGGTIDNLTKRMVKVAAQINLGLLIIDEIQNVHKSHSGGDERMINFITELVNTIGIPVVVIGTFKAMYLFESSLANSRRGIPDMFNENITSFLLEESWEWNEFIENLWDLQYIKNYTPLTNEFKKSIYFHTLGIPDIVVKLFMHVQAKAILNGSEEKITLPLINEVASKSLRLLQSVFEKIRRGGSISDVNELDDVKPEWNSFNEYIKQATHQVNLYGKTSKEHSRAYQQREKEVTLVELINFAFNLVSDTELAESLAKKVYAASEGMEDKQGMYTQVAQLALEVNNSILTSEETKQEKSEQKSDKKIRIKPMLKDDDIRFIVQHGAKKGMATEEALMEAGVIKECIELLDVKNII